MSRGRAYATLLRVGLAEAVAYRAEFIVWMLTTTMPLVMLGLWTAVTRDGPFGRFGQDEFVAYYLGSLVVRTLTGNWVAWQINQEIRMGTLSMRLLRPVHPFVAYSAQHLAALPLRAAIALPITIVLLATTPGSQFASSVGQVAASVLSVGMAWILAFFIMCILGTLGMWIERSMAVFEVYMGLFAVLSGYLVPLELLPGWVETIATWLPFRYLLGFPVEVLTGLLPPGALARGLAIQAAMVVATFLAAMALWRRGLRRFEAYGA